MLHFHDSSAIDIGPKWHRLSLKTILITPEAFGTLKNQRLRFPLITCFILIAFEITGQTVPSYLVSNDVPYASKR